LTGGAGAPVGVLMIKAGAVVGTAGATLEVTGYVLDERYTDAMISAMSAFASAGIGEAGEIVYKSLKKTTLSELPENLQLIVKAGAIDVPRLGIDKLKDVTVSYNYDNIYFAIEEIMDPANKMCTLPDWYDNYSEMYRTISNLNKNVKNSANQDNVSNQKNSQGSSANNNYSQNPPQNGNDD